MGNGRCPRKASLLLAIVHFLIEGDHVDRKSTRLNSSHSQISYAVFCLKTENQSKLRVDVRYKCGGVGNADDDFWSILGLDRAMLIFNAFTTKFHPQPIASLYECASSAA